MRNLHRLVPLVAVVALTGGCRKKPDPEPPVAPVADRDRLQGTWAVESIDDGRSLSRDEFKDDRFIFEGDTLTVAMGVAPHKFTFALDESQDPKVLVLTEVPDPGAKHEPKKIEALYKFEGSALVLAFETSEQPKRPTEFKARAQVGGKVTFTAGKPPERSPVVVPGVQVITLEKALPGPPTPHPFRPVDTKLSTKK
jgi:uncharacterized protein (TIGR03067 family)